MKYIYSLIFSMLSLYSFAQNDKSLKLLHNKENVVASAIDGNWKAKNIKYFEKIKFTKDSTVLKSISEMYFDKFKKFKIYHAGHMEISRENKIYSFPFFLTEHNGNPHLVFFRERNNNPIGDSESFILFIAIGDTKSQDKLFIGGDFNNQAFNEFERKVEN